MTAACVTLAACRTSCEQCHVGDGKGHPTLTLFRFGRRLALGGEGVEVDDARWVRPSFGASSRTRPSTFLQLGLATYF
jgi:hypothetical protein